MARKTVHFHVYRSEKQYVAECAELPIVAQGSTLDEVAENIREATTLHLEDEDLANLDLDPNPVIELTLEVPPVGDVAYI